MSYIQLTNPISVIPTSFSISWWMNLTISQIGGLFSKSRTGTNGYLSIIGVSDALYFESQDGSDTIQLTIPSTVKDDGEWHHYVWTSGASNVKVYVDGVNTGSHGSAMTDTTRQLFQYFGAEQAEFSISDFVGTLDEVRFYNKELSSTEVTTLYNATDSHTGYTWAFMCPRLFSEPIKFGGGSGVKQVHYDSGDLE